MKVAELLALTPDAELLELKPDARYIVAIPSDWPMMRAIEFQEYLRSQDVNCIVVPVADLRIFELQRETTVTVPTDVR